MDDLTLAADFPAATREQWLALVERVLKGADFDKKLVARSYDGIPVEPLYPKADGAPLAARAPGPWRIAQRMEHPDRSAANDLALADLQGGADALTLVFPSAAGARGFGLDVRNVDDLDEVLRDIKLDLIHMRLEGGAEADAVAGMLVALTERRGHALAELDLDLGFDPIGAMASSGRLPASWTAMAARQAEVLADGQARGFRGRAFLADGRPYHEAGAAEAQELAAVLATAVAYLRALEAAGHPLDAARDALSFRLAADADELLTVAKFRALRRLWTRVEEACGLAAKPIRLHAETAWRMTTRRDPWVNMLRTTVAVFSAGIGGADTITCLPFTAALGLPDGFARRMARNTQLILQEEAHLWRVADPAAGAGGFEALTDALCDRAWRLFQEIEREGGVAASLEAGALQARVAAVRAARERAVATRRDPITGTSEFPNLSEIPVSVLLPSPLQRRVGGGGRDEPGIQGKESDANPIPPLPSIRVAEPYEHLRDASDAQLARTGARPRVFLANLGAPADFTARAGFAKNFFEAGGIEAATNDGFSSPEEAAAAFATSGARLACLCSSDDIYAVHAAAVATRLRSAGAREVYFVGRPDRLPPDVRSAVSASIFPGCDALAILTDAIDTAPA